VVLYAGRESSGQAQLAFFMLNYLGQKEVKILDGSLADWKAAGLPEEVQEKSKPAVEYSPQAKPEVMAEYDYVKSGQAQIIDVRPFVDFGKGRIPGSIALDPANVVKGDKVKSAGDLATVFSRLDKEKPIVVYSDDYSRSALVAYALQLMGYQASICSWEDWKAHEAAQAGNETAPAEDGAVDSKYTKLGKT
jgi:thiosulfate/3-mercaptopyruvate sulfurtransferase